MKIKRLIRRIKTLINRIKNLIYWFPVIWNDRDWDSDYLLIVFLHKLRRMEKQFRENGLTVNSSMYADDMHYTCLLVNRIINHDYLENAENAVTGPDTPRFAGIRECYFHSRRQIDQDVRELTDTLRKHILFWSD